MYGYSFELITGPMSCGKTEELLSKKSRYEEHTEKIEVIR